MSWPIIMKAIEKLFSRHTFGIKLGLHVQEALMKGLGNPERAYGVIHVAGTNGKGSVCTYLESILRQAGYKTGLYTSPHLVRFNERIRVNGEEIPEKDLDIIVDDVEKISSKIAGELKQEPTFFESSTAMAFEYFKRRGVQIAVIEVGMGGRLDATNVVTPLISVITRISLEHTQYLGNDVPTIAGEKAGIIKQGRPVISGCMDEEALEVIRKTAAERRSVLREAGKTVTARLVSMDFTGQKTEIQTEEDNYGVLKSGMIGVHQVENLATAIASVEVLNSACSMDIERKSVKKGIAEAVWPGRFDIVKTEPPVIIDGAHNPGGAKVLAETLHKVCGKRPVGLLFGMCGDKDVTGVMRHLGGIVKKMWIVPVPNERNMEAAKIMDAARILNCEIKAAGLKDAAGEAEKWAAEQNGIVCIAGSLFLAGQALEMYGKNKVS